MDLRQLRYIVGVADESTFSAAAQHLRVAQPALTRQIRDLESELGVGLFVRGARRATLTAAGIASVQIARFVIDEVERAVDRARLTGRGLAGKCHIGVSRVPTLEGLAGRLLDRLRAQYPGIVGAVTEVEFDALWSGVADASFDIGIGARPAIHYAGLHHETQFTDVLDGALLAADHPFANRASIRLDEMRGETIIGNADSLQEVWPMVLAELQQRQFEPQEIRTVAGTDTLIALVVARRGWTLVPRRVRHRIPRGLVCVPLDDWAVPIRVVRMWRRADTRPITRTVLDVLRRIEADERAGPSVARSTADTGSVQFGVPARLELRHLRNFLVVAESGSVGRAAQRLDLTQPALSRQMRDLEHDLDAQVFDRETRGVELTPAGEAFREDVREIIAAVDGLQAATQSAERGTTGRCIVGLMPVPRVRAILGRAINECETLYAPMEVTPIELGTAQQLIGLQNSTIDVGLLHLVSTPAMLRDFRRIVLYEDRVCDALVHAGHPLASRGEISIDELATTPLLFVGRDTNPWFYDDLLDAFAAVNFSPRIEREVNGLELVWALVAEGQGWSIASSTGGAPPPRGVVSLRLTDFSLPYAAHLVHRHDETRPSVLAVVDAIQRSAEVPVTIGARNVPYDDQHTVTSANATTS
ncbi:MAG TPA: LysR family transcriptional regulator [Gemmatimonadaceae bacterium]|nr:LysR family transcriptional regulator [Gemmatimonadaceae bacterium]